LHHRFHGGHHGYRHFYYFSLPYYRYYYSYPGYYYYPEPYPRDNAQEPYYDRFSDVREKTKRQEAEKAAEEARVNRHLDNIAEAFATGDYDEAVLRASDAVNAEPDNTVLLFVYSQSVFASGEYNKAAGLLREALSRLDPDRQEVFYPLGLYADENILTEQIATLSEALEAEQFKADLQLLMGYQLLGVGRFDEALEVLQLARQDYLNTTSAEVLIEVLEKTRQGGRLPPIL
jgi:tetratricopeptide (TPR) repeat protein